MSFSNGFRGTPGGAVQQAYTDQPGVAVPGMLAFASDINLADAVFIGEPDGIPAGHGVVFEDGPTGEDNKANLQRPNVLAMLPDTATISDDFAGVVIYTEQMQSDEIGRPGWAYGRVGRILMGSRVGGRIYVRCPLEVDHTDPDIQVMMMTQDTADATRGQFTPVGDIVVPNAKFITSASILDPVMIEFG